MAMLIFIVLVNIQVEDICLIHLSMERLTPVLNNNGCSETIILKDMSELVEVGTSFSSVMKVLQIAIVLKIGVHITRLLQLLQESLKSLTLPMTSIIALSLI